MTKLVERPQSDSEPEGMSGIGNKRKVLRDLEIDADSDPAHPDYQLPSDDSEFVDAEKKAK